MLMIQSRRGFLASLSAAGAATTFGTGTSLADEGPPETTTVRLRQDPSICVAPWYIAEDLLRAEGFSDVRYVQAQANLTHTQMIARGEIDFGLFFAGSLVFRLDTGAPITALAGVHGGCYELFAHEPIRTISDLKGKKVGIDVLGSGKHRYVAIMAAHVGLDPRSVKELETLGEVSRQISSSLELQAVLRAIAAHAVALAGADAGAFCAYDEQAQVFHIQATHDMEQEGVESLTRRPVRLGEGAVGLAGAQRTAVQIPDTDVEPGYPLDQVMRPAGYRALLAVPLSAGWSSPARRRAISPPRPSISCRLSPISRCSRSRTPSCSRSSSAKGASSRPPAGTSPSSSPT